MSTGLFIATDGSVQVEYAGVSIPITKSKYQKAGYKPDFDKLPPKTNTERHRRSCVMPRGPKGEKKHPSN
jgi:hypothetical protein